MMRKQQISPLQVRVIFDSVEELTDFMGSDHGVVVGNDINTSLNPQPEQGDSHGTI